MTSFAHEIYRNPIYIYAPAYKEYSAGVRCLHYLCHALNQMGVLSWIVPSEKSDGTSSYVSGFLNTPLLTAEIAQSHFDFGLPPIVIYPESTEGNPLNAQVVARWLLSFPGTIGGPSQFPSSDFLFAYSAAIARSYGDDVPIMFIPPVAADEILKAKELASSGVRDIDGLVYAGKYRGFVGNPRLPNWAPPVEYVEIWREGPNKQTREEVLGLLARSKVLFAFENSTLITEATLLGTPVILVKSEFFNQLIAEDELSNFGCAWSTQTNALEVASKELPKVWEPYLNSLEQVNDAVKTLAEKLHAFAGSTDYLQLINLQIDRPSEPLSRVKLALRILKSDGPLELAIEILKTLRRLGKGK